ncbi:glycerophosphotransferase [Blastococcus sp. TF02-09]|uniref:glycerophosphotransferase n=1 Tax=Blastococcus sp. TF02-09 TaxID=2250576 RepID=UPI000DEBADAB|nr:glycerophosphotransferase [Blastococcus sp. TF02-9]RBY80132.1 glycerophosphotransferase [Blastococcus sp. TF02-9]
MALPIKQVGREIVRGVPAQAVIGGIVVGAVAGALGARWVCLVALTASVIGEPFLHRRQHLVVRALRTLSLGLTVRIVFRLLCATAVLAHRPASSRDVFLLVLSSALLVLGRALYVFTSGRLTARRNPAVETRNVPLDGLDVPKPPPAWLTRWSGSVVSAVELLIIVPACLSSRPGSPVVWLAPVAVLAMFAAAIWCELGARRAERTLGPADVVAVVQRHLDESRPAVALYFGDGPRAVYQANMWLPALERLSQPSVVVLRNRASLGALGPTRLPVLCVPSAEHLMALDLSTVAVSLYVANIGNNIHMLRVPGIRSAFIGHGDSDKKASFNPYSRVYSQVWVAGPAGRQRYREAAVGVHDGDVVEIGRPQLDEPATPARADDHVPTVLYAPTWEGWDDEQAYSSLATHGVALAASALREGSGVRLLYRPHPFTGRRDPAVAAAHAQIVEMIEEANRRDGGSAEPVLEPATDNALTEIHDRFERAVRSGQLDAPLSALEAEAQLRAVEDQYWRAMAPGRHAVMTQQGPSLLSCFAQADVLVTDVSSVLSDFVSTGRPYVVCNNSGAAEDDFLAEVPSARAGHVLGPDQDVEDVLRLVRGESPDLLADERRALRRELLGPDSPSSQYRLERAVEALIASARPEVREGVQASEFHIEGVTAR